MLPSDGPAAEVAATATTAAATETDPAAKPTRIPRTHAASCASPPLQDESPLPPSFGVFEEDECGEDGRQFLCAEFFGDSSAGGDDNVGMLPPARDRGAPALAGLGPVGDFPADASPHFPSVENAALQRVYATERLMWRAHFCEWGVSWKDELYAEVVEHFTRAKYVSPSYIIHYASTKVTCDAPATRNGVEEWFSGLLIAGAQGVSMEVEAPLCRARRAHVLTVITAAYAKYGFSLPESVNARPIALSMERQQGNPRVPPAFEDRGGISSAPCVRREGKQVAAVARVENVVVAPLCSPEASGHVMEKSLAKVEDVGAQVAKERHDGQWSE